MRATPLIQALEPQREKEGKKTYEFLFSLFLSLCFGLFLPAVVSAQDGPLPVNGEWPAGLQYVVRPGDTLLTASVEMGLDLEQMGCLISPSFGWDQPLVIGSTLTVPDIPFVCYTVQPGDTLADIANAYGITVNEIVAEPWNRQGGEVIRRLRIRLNPSAEAALPNPLPVWTGGESTVAPSAAGQMPLPANWAYGSGSFAWPVYGWLTQTFHPGHSAIDVGAFTGTPVTAADRGVVIRAGWSDAGYGNFVVIDHKIDYLTLYAHLNDILVSEGQVVAQGQLIGHVGSTGNSTGPHLHFEIRDFGQRVDPLGVLGR